MGDLLTYEHVFINWDMPELDLCDVQIVDESAVQAAFADQANEEEITYLADTFQVLANPTRLRLVEALSRRDGLRGCAGMAAGGLSAAGFRSGRWPREAESVG